MSIRHRAFSGPFPFNIVPDAWQPSGPNDLIRNVSLPLATYVKAWWQAKAFDYNINLGYSVTFGTTTTTGTLSGSGTVALKSLPPWYRSSEAISVIIDSSERDLAFIPWTWPLLPDALPENPSYPTTSGAFPQLDYAYTDSGGGHASGKANWNAAWFFAEGGTYRMSKDAMGNYRTVFAFSSQGGGFGNIQAEQSFGVPGGSLSVTVDGQVAPPTNLYYNASPGTSTSLTGSAAFNFNSFWTP